MNERDHPTDGTLMGVISGGTAAAGVWAHLEGCVRCRSRIARMESAESRLAELFEAVPASPVPPLRQHAPGAQRTIPAGGRRTVHEARGRRYFGWAAAAAACLLLIAGVPQLRALLLQPVIDRLAAGLRVSGPADSTAPAGFQVSFPVRDSVLIVQIAAAQRGGEVLLMAHPGDLALVQSTSSRRIREVDVRIGRVVISNDANDDATFTVLIPHGVGVRLIIAGEEIAVVVDSTGSFRWIFGQAPP